MKQSDSRASSKVLREGWLYTGDWATVDEDGFIYPRGRSNALVKLDGYRVHPVEVEEYVMQRLPLLRAIAVPYESNNAGTRLALFVKPLQGGKSLSVADVDKICREGLPRCKVPAYVEVVVRFPLNAALKVDRFQLALRVTQRADASYPVARKNRPLTFALQRGTFTRED